ncbi:hypothetical protein CCUG63695_01380 [Mycobacteroides franklinii]|uniref:Uncharacterized protein n=1 Tax=Mycobacteroides franklinii TaxID=948102 RepID=A0A4R8QVW6_9MYCO|nr:hypothetical protein CCUG64054_00380 [Mycobacteroides franklinii]TDZ48066.1 hypothetical protein CCUG63697_04364 [Mycobacteroides franklinii]TDZ60275.1 hypothetical protein CCUG63696_00383 [Mycobacteroides franklinii]TDZ65674.1 hypothetical protein CCUG63695_01380 [Mycobacteroides franklinii]TDZ73843.1 hypothetical protein CCUG64056_00380 [Mycobacteroides franklinii]
MRSLLPGCAGNELLDVVALGAVLPAGSGAELSPLVITRAAPTAIMATAAPTKAISTGGCRYQGATRPDFWSSKSGCSAESGYDICAAYKIQSAVPGSATTGCVDDYLTPPTTVSNTAESSTAVRSWRSCRMTT